MKFIQGTDKLIEDLSNPNVGEFLMWAGFLVVVLGFGVLVGQEFQWIRENTHKVILSGIGIIILGIFFGAVAERIAPKEKTGNKH